MTTTDSARAKTAFASLALAVLINGCGGERLVIPLGTEFGTYTLATIDGKSPPVIIAATQVGNVEVIEASISLAADNAFRDVTDTRITTTDTSYVSSDTVSGSWVRLGNTIVFTPESDAEYQMQLGSASLTGDRSSLTWIYKR